MTLNGVISVILRYFTEFGSFGAKVVEDRPIVSATKIMKKCSPRNLVFSNM